MQATIRFQPLRVALALGLAALLGAGSALANAVVQSVKGEARATIDTRGGPVVQGQRHISGTSFITGAGGQVVLRFDDGQQVVVNENSEFRIAEYRYNEAQPKQDRSVFELVKGALRVVTGALGKRNRDAFSLRIPQSTIGIRGTDFMVVLINPAFLSVTSGAIAATNAAGTATFAAGSLGTIASSTALGVTIGAGALPAAAAGAFGNMSAVTLSAVGGATGGVAGGAAGGAAGATGAVAGGVGLGTAAAVVGGAAAAAAAASGNSGGGNSTTTHH